MWPYFLIISLVLLLQIKHEKIDEKYNLALSFIILFCFAALRGNGNGDYFAYLRYSTYIASFEQIFDTSFPMEIGFRIISYIVNTLGAHPQLVIASMNLISLTCIYNFIRRYSPDKLISIIFFLPLYFQFDMHATRTAVAIGISTVSFKYLYEKEILKYFLIILLASFFHKSALILIIMYPIANLKIDIKIGLISILTTIIMTSYISISGMVVDILGAFGLETISVKYYNYTQNLDYGYPFELYDPRFMLVIVIYIVGKYLLNSSDKVQNMLINYIWMNIMLIILFREHTIFVTRLSSFFNIYTIIIIPYIINFYKGPISTKLYHFIKLSSILVYLLYIGGLLIGSVDYRLFSL